MAVGKGSSELPKMWDSPLILLQRLNITSSKLVRTTQLVFAKARHTITSKYKSGRSPRLGKVPKICGFLFNISAVIEDSLALLMIILCRIPDRDVT